jgi:hypothetical protein
VDGGVIELDFDLLSLLGLGGGDLLGLFFGIIDDVHEGIHVVILVFVGGETHVFILVTARTLTVILRVERGLSFLFLEHLSGCHGDLLLINLRHFLPCLLHSFALSLHCCSECSCAFENSLIFLGVI